VHNIRLCQQVVRNHVSSSQKHEVNTLDSEKLDHDSDIASITDLKVNLLFTSSKMQDRDILRSSRAF
jgi:hypothetical protein